MNMNVSSVAGREAVFLSSIGWLKSAEPEFKLQTGRLYYTDQKKVDIGDLFNT